MKMNSHEPLWTDIVVTFSNLHGKLKAEPSAMGLNWFPRQKAGDFIYNVSLIEETAIVRVNMSIDFILQNDVHIAYGYGLNPRCNITDEEGYSIPAFGPVKLSYDE